MTPIRVMLVDDHRLLLETWYGLLNADTRFTVLDIVSDPQDALDRIKEHRPQVLLCDINMQPLDGQEITRQTRLLSPATRIIGVSMYCVPAFASKMFKAGASGYVTKNSSVEEFQEAILEVVEGKKYICKDIRELLAETALIDTEDRPATGKLTRKEVDVIREIREGLSSKEIASKLKVALKTVEVHRYNIMKKLKLRNTAALVNFAYLNGL